MSDFLKPFCWVDEIHSDFHILPFPFANSYNKLSDSTPLYKYPFPPNPPQGLLVSMALRYDHAFLIPSSYSQQTIVTKRVILTQMRQLYEEVSGNGFWKPENNESYEKMFRDIQKPKVKRLK